MSVSVSVTNIVSVSGKVLSCIMDTIRNDKELMRLSRVGAVEDVKCDEL